MTELEELREENLLMRATIEESPDGETGLFTVGIRPPVKLYRVKDAFPLNIIEEMKVILTAVNYRSGVHIIIKAQGECSPRYLIFNETTGHSYVSEPES